MGLLNVFDIAGSALSAQSVRLNVTASNLANINSISSSTEQTYRARQPVFQTMYNNFMRSNASSVGVKVSGIVENQQPLRKEYKPEHPYADEDGYIYLPNVNAIEEMANMISASRSYQTNVEMLNTAKTLMTRTLSLGQ